VDHSAIMRQVTATAVATALLTVLAACSSPAAPPPPPASTSSSTAAGDNSGVDGSNARSATNSKGDSGGSSDSSGGSDTSSSDSGTDSSSSTDDTSASSGDFKAGGADISDDDTKAAVKKCLDKQLFYDRFAKDGVGECSKLKLAKVDCTTDGIRKVLSAALKTQFDAALADGYKDFTLDQCLDCPTGNKEELCKNTKGEQKEGTKVFYVKMDKDQITGKALVFSIRPNQGASN
jgi:hypothetical protein